MKTPLPFLLLLSLLFAAVSPGYGLTPQDYFSRGVAKTKKGDYEGAVVDFTKALELRPDFADARTNLAISYYNLGAARQKQRQFDGAISDYSKAIQVLPGFAIAYGNRGTAKGSKGDLDGAITDFRQALALKPDDADAKANLAMAMKARGGAVGPNSGGVPANPPPAATALPHVRAVGWIDRVTQATTTDDLSSAKPAVASGWHSDFVLRCQDGHDYLLFRTDSSVMPKNLTFGPGALYEVDGRAQQTSPDYFKSYPMVARLMNGSGPIAKVETRDVSRSILVQSIKQAQQ